MKYITENVENKDNGWKVVTVIDPSGSSTDHVSINRVNKKGETFPNFDGIVDGATIDGDLWQSTAGKWYLFAPKGTSTRPTARQGGPVQAQRAVSASVREAQEHKDVSIRLSSTIRMATDVVLVLMKNEAWVAGEIKVEIEKWRRYFWETWDMPVDRQWPNVK